VGIALAWVIWFPRGAKAVQADEEPRGLRGFFHGGLGFDTLYAGLIAWPYVESAHANRRDVLHLPAFAIRQGIYGMGLMLRGTQNGKLRWYLAVMAGGVAAAIYLVAFR
jgi:NADH-quinone oxidoreductase subunit L